MQVSKPKKGYKFVDAGFGKLEEIPEDWELSDLRSDIFFQEGPGLRNWQFTSKGMKVINVTNLVDGYLDTSNTDRYISKSEFEKKYSHFAIDPNDIVVASSGNSFGKVAVVMQKDLPLMMNTSVIRFKPLSKNIDRKFLRYFLESNYFKKQIDILITGSAQPNFGPFHLKQIKILRPTQKEQQKMASIFSNIDETIQNTDRLIDQTKLLKKGMTKKLFKKGLGHSKFKKIKWYYKKEIEIPADWNVSELKKLAKIRYGLSQPPPLDENGIQMIRATDIKFGKIIKNKPIKILKSSIPISRSPYLSEGEIIVVRSGVYSGDVGLVTKDFADSIAGYDLVVTPTNDLDSEYLLEYLLSPLVQNYFQNLSSRSAQSHLNSKQVGDALTLIPKKKEQQKIASTLTNFNSKIQNLESKKSTLVILKKGLMQKLLTGKIRVKV